MKQSVQSLPAYLSQCAHEHGNDLLYTMLRGEEAIDSSSYGELESKAIEYSNALVELFPTGSRIILLFEQSIDFIRAFMACNAAKMVAVPVPDPSKSGDALTKLATIIDNSQAVAILTSPAIQSLAQGLPLPNSQELPWITLADLHGSAGGKYEERIASIGPDDISFLQYTSGSTRAPRGVMVSQQNIMANLDYIARTFALQPGEVSVTWLPMFHDMGLIGSILGALYGRTRTYIYSPLDFVRRPALWLKAISKYGAAIAGGPNFAFELCANRIRPQELEGLDLSTWRLAFVGAEPVRAATLKNFTQIFAAKGFRNSAFFPCYGMAETTLMVTGGQSGIEPAIINLERASLTTSRVEISAAESVAPLVSCGHEHAEYELILVERKNDAITRVPGDLDVGEVWVRGAHVARGYWNNPTETELAFSCHLADGSGPYLNTGDLAFHHQGELYVVGRTKDLVIIAGKNYYPQDIEFIAEQAHPACRPACCAAFSIEAVTGSTESLVVVQEVKTSGERQALQEIAETIITKITGSIGVQVSHLVLIRSASIPRTSSGKIQRSRCRQMYLDSALPVLFDFNPLRPTDSPQDLEKVAPRNELETELARIWSDVLGIEKIGVQDNFFELGGDSLRVVHVASTVGQQYGIPFTITHLVEGPTIDDMAVKIEEMIIDQLSGMDETDVEALLQAQASGEMEETK